MAHVAHLKFTPDAMQYQRSGASNADANLNNLYGVSRAAIDYFTSGEDTNHDGSIRVTLYKGDGTQFRTIEMTKAQFEEFKSWYHGEMTFVEETPATPPLALLEDPIIYTKPFIGESETGKHYYEFHNPNGKSAIRVFLDEVNHTRFDTLPADAGNHFVLITKALICIKCLCSTIEQQGLEFGIKGLHKRTSAAELNNLRQIQEDEANA